MTEYAPGLHARTGQDVDPSAYDRYLGRWSRLFVPSVIEAAQVRSGNRVLDISTGTGEAAVALLPTIGPSGTLVGADISPEMVRSAVQRINDTNFLPVVTDGQELPFRDGCFDAVICQLGLQFFPDPAAGLREFHRVLRPGGKASVCVIGSADRAPMWGFLAKAISRRQPEKRDILMAGFALSDAKRVEDLFSEAGFVRVGIKRETRGLVIKNLDEYWQPIESGVGSVPQSYVSLDESIRQDVRAEVSGQLAEFMVDGQLHMSVEMLIGHGQSARDDEKPARSSVELPAPIDRRLGELLVCPKTKGPLIYDASTNELISREAGLAFPIRDGIPIMVSGSGRSVGS